MDSPGSAAREGAIYKPGGGRLFTTSGCNTNNSSKNNPCAIADLFGDWREELVMRAESNTKIRIWTTAYPTTYGLYTLARPSVPQCDGMAVGRLQPAPSQELLRG